MDTGTDMQDVIVDLVARIGEKTGPAAMMAACEVLASETVAAMIRAAEQAHRMSRVYADTAGTLKTHGMDETLARCLSESKRYARVAMDIIAAVGGDGGCVSFLTSIPNSADDEDEGVGGPMPGGVGGGEDGKDEPREVLSPEARVAAIQNIAGFPDLTRERICADIPSAEEILTEQFRLAMNDGPDAAASATGKE